MIFLATVATLEDQDTDHLALCKQPAETDALWDLQHFLNDPKNKAEPMPGWGCGHRPGRVFRALSVKFFRSAVTQVISPRD